jgi:hypothetical protein
MCDEGLLYKCRASETGMRGPQIWLKRAQFYHPQSVISMKICKRYTGSSRKNWSPSFLSLQIEHLIQVGFSVGITDWRNLQSTPLVWPLVAWYTEFHDDRFRHLSNIQVSILTIWEAAVLVLLMGHKYRHTDWREDVVSHWDGLRCYDIHTEFHKEWFRDSKVIGGGFTDTQTAWWYRKCI